MKRSSRSHEPAFRTTESKRAGSEQPQERLIEDKRARLTPSDMVEQRLEGLLRCSAPTAGTPRRFLPRADGCANRTIEYTPVGGPVEGADRSEKDSDQGDRSIYAISIEHSQAVEILTGLRQSPCRFWKTEHRGLLLIHTRARKPGKGASASHRSPGRNAFLGVVELVDCTATTQSGADPDEIEYHWVLVNPRVFAPPLPYAGRPGLFLVTERRVADALARIGISKRPRG